MWQKECINPSKHVWTSLQIASKGLGSWGASIPGDTWQCVGQIPVSNVLVSYFPSFRGLLWQQLQRYPDGIRHRAWISMMPSHILLMLNTSFLPKRTLFFIFMCVHVLCKRPSKAHSSEFIRNCRYKQSGSEFHGSGPL